MNIFKRNYTLRRFSQQSTKMGYAVVASYCYFGKYDCGIKLQLQRRLVRQRWLVIHKGRGEYNEKEKYSLIAARLAFQIGGIMVYFTPPDKNDCLTRIVLDGDEYLFKFSFNYEGGFWVLGIYENENNPIVAGIKITPCFPVNWYFRQYIKLPKGVLGVVTRLEKIGRQDFVNGNAQFVYITKDEYAEYVGGGA